MNRMFLLFCSVLCLSGTSLSAYAYGYPNNSDSSRERNKNRLDSLPNSTHISPNGRGGYTWTEPGNPYADSYLDRLPETHSITPDGRGGYYAR